MYKNDSAQAPNSWTTPTNHSAVLHMACGVVNPPCLCCARMLESIPVEGRFEHAIVCASTSRSSSTLSAAVELHLTSLAAPVGHAQKWHGTLRQTECHLKTEAWDLAYRSLYKGVVTCEDCEESE